MKNNLFRLLLIALLCFTLVFALASCDIISGFLPGNEQEEEEEDCTEHTDADRDGICDDCGDVINEDSGEDVDDTAFVVSAIEAIEYNSYTVPYDAKPHSIAIDESKLPSGVQVYYSTGTEYTKVGAYTVFADFYYKGKLLEDSTKSATLTITKANYDMSGVSVSGSTKYYDGKAVEASLTGKLPVGVSYTLEIKNEAGETVNKMVDAGIYTVWATFNGDTLNYYEIAPISATVEIRRATVSGIIFRDKKIEYDGTEKSIYAENVPAGITVTYEGNGQIEKGVYTVTAKFEVGANYEPIADMTATMSITKKLHDMDGVSLSGSTSYYDGTSKMPVLEGNVPSGVTVSITVVNEAGETVTEVVNAGVYTVTASFGVGEAYEPIDDMICTITIRPAIIPVQFKDESFGYDGDPKSIFVTGLPSFVEVTYTGNGKTSPGVYTVTATFSESPNFEPIKPMTATMTIELGDPAKYPTKTLVYEEVTGGYAVTGVDGNPALIVIPATYNGKPVVSIKSNAFRGNTTIEYVNIPASVTNIGNAAFRDCVNLETLYLGNFSVSVNESGALETTGVSSLKTIGQQAFANTEIKVVDIPDSVTAIGIGAFEGCERIEKMTIPFIGGSRNSTHSYLAYLFGADAAETGYNKVSPALKTVIISNSATEIPARAFYKIASIESVYIGKSVTKIGNNAFAYCSALRDIYVPKNVTTITAAAAASASPFWGCPDDFMIVLESSASASLFAKYYAQVSEQVIATMISNKTYEDYCMNKENYRVGDLTDSSAAGIFADGQIISGFASDKLEYTISADINKGYPTITVLPSSSVATTEVVKSGAAQIKITVTSGDGTKATVYTINFEVTGTFTATSTVVNKNGADATVSFVIDDGFVGTGMFAKSMLEKYPSLTLSFAIYTNKFVTLKTEDLDGDGIKEYVLDENGNYTYTIRDTAADSATGYAGQEMIDFWRDVLTSTPGRSEIIAHSHTHAFWGTNDEGGSMFAIGNSSGTISKNPTTVAKGSITAEMYAAQQIVKDLFGDLGSRAKTFVTPGISVTGSTKTTKTDVTILLRGHIVRLVNDTAISQTSTAGELVVNSDTEIDLQSNKLTIPAGTPISTTATYENNVIPAGTVITVIECSMVVPAGTQIIGHGTTWGAVYDQAYEDGVTIAARNTGASASLGNGIYTKDWFSSVDRRQLQRSFGISSSKDETAEQLEADVEGWCSYIDKAVELKGWVSYCIHAITDTLDKNKENQGGHMITKTQGETLFSHAVSYGDKLWIANYTDATLYYHEWYSAKTTASYNASTGEITVSLTDNERDDIYNMPLTVKIAVPATWSSASVGENTYEVRYNDDGTAYVYVDIAPETSVVVRGN